MMLVRRSRGLVSSSWAVGLRSIRTEGGDFRWSPHSATANGQNLGVYVSIRSGGTGTPQATAHVRDDRRRRARIRGCCSIQGGPCALHMRSAKDARMRRSDGRELRAGRMRNAKQCEDDSYQNYDECFDLAQSNPWRSPSNRRRYSRREAAHRKELGSTQASTNR